MNITILQNYLKDQFENYKTTVNIDIVGEHVLILVLNRNDITKVEYYILVASIWIEQDTIKIMSRYFGRNTTERNLYPYRGHITAIDLQNPDSFQQINKIINVAIAKING